jgi:hypothetical protein
MMHRIRGLALATAVLVLGACGGAGTAAPPPSPSPRPSFTALGLAASCKVLRADMLANGGTPDAATLRKVITHTTDGELMADAQRALRNLGKTDNTALSFDLAFLGRDCQPTGVRIPL